MPSKSTRTISKIDKFLDIIRIQVIPCKLTSFQQTLMPGFKLYRSKIGSHVSWGQISVHFIWKDYLRSTYFKKVLENIFILLDNFWRALKHFMHSCTVDKLPYLLHMHLLNTELNFWMWKVHWFIKHKQNLLIVVVILC